MSANVLHPTLQRAQVEIFFDEGRPGDAVLEAFLEVERLVRGLARASGYSPLVLMGEAFAPVIGPLTDRRAGIGEQLSMQRLFVESFATYRPDAEHAAAPEDEAQAVDGVLVADALARELARIAERLGSPLAHDS